MNWDYLFWLGGFFVVGGLLGKCYKWWKKLKKPRGIPGAFPELLKPGLQKDFEAAYQAGQITAGFDFGSAPDQGGFMCGDCSLISADMNEIIDHQCPSPPPLPVNVEPDFCPECGRKYEDE